MPTGVIYLIFCSLECFDGDDRLSFTTLKCCCALTALIAYSCSGPVDILCGDVRADSQDSQTVVQPSSTTSGRDYVSKKTQERHPMVPVSYSLTMCICELWVSGANCFRQMSSCSKAARYARSDWQESEYTKAERE